MSMAFLSVPDSSGGTVAIARSPMEKPARDAGARFATAAGWNVATGYGDPARERQACSETVGWADLCDIGKLELQGPAAELAALGAELTGGPVSGPSDKATPIGGSWWCPMSATRVLVLLAPGGDGLHAAIDEARPRLAPGAGVVDLTSALGALVLAGPRARDVIASFCALDLRPVSSSVGSYHPGSVGRSPGAILHEGPDRFRLLFGSAYGESIWEIVADAALQYDGRPVGREVLTEIQTHPDGTTTDA